MNQKDNRKSTPNARADTPHTPSAFDCANAVFGGETGQSSANTASGSAWSAAGGPSFPGSSRGIRTPSFSSPAPGLPVASSALSVQGVSRRELMRVVMRVVALLHMVGGTQSRVTRSNTASDVVISHPSHRRHISSSSQSSISAFALALSNLDAFPVKVAGSDSGTVVVVVAGCVPRLDRDPAP